MICQQVWAFQSQLLPSLETLPALANQPQRQGPTQHSLMRYRLAEQLPLVSPVPSADPLLQALSA